jgi:hypothetical protein
MSVVKVGSAPATAAVGAVAKTRDQRAHKFSMAFE